ncbi:hypothetical protein HaLaN_31359, partial [Haematococcus lacustris]
QPQLLHQPLSRLH